jgi:glycopeptide antibiotics resistance protein
MMRARLLAIILVAYVAFILNLALLQFQATNAPTNFVPFRSMIRDWSTGGWPFIINFVGNVVAFLPMGLLPPFLRTRPTKLWQVLVFSFGLSLFIEGCQFVSGRRVPDVDDLILNTLGGYLGFVLSQRIKRPSRAVNTTGDSETGLT